MFQKFTSESNSTLPRLAAESGASSSLDQEQIDVVASRREDYLDRVVAPLTRLLPFARRQELRLEIRQHLDAMIHAYQELGETPECACDKAFAQFGTPEEVAESIKKSAVYPTRWQQLRAWCSQPRMSIAGALPVLLLAASLYFGLARPVTQTQTVVTPASVQVASVGGKTIINGVPFSHKNAVISAKIPCTACHRGNPGESPEQQQKTLIRTKAALEAAWRAEGQKAMRERGVRR